MTLWYCCIRVKLLRSLIGLKTLDASGSFIESPQASGKEYDAEGGGQRSGTTIKASIEITVVVTLLVGGSFYM